MRGFYKTLLRGLLSTGWLWGVVVGSQAVVRNGFAVPLGANTLLEAPGGIYQAMLSPLGFWESPGSPR